MSRQKRLSNIEIQTLAQRRWGVIATLTASLMLSACSGSSDMLPSLSMADTPPPQATADAGEPAQPQTELQKATTYWGTEFVKKPTDLQTALNYAKNLKALGEKQKALAVFQQASMLHDGNKELASEYGRLALELDQVNAAAQLLAVADDPTKPDWRVISARGTVFAKQGKYSEAIPFYDRALTLSPNQPAVLNNLAMAYAMMGDAKKAEEILRQAAAAGDTSPKVRENLALVLGLQGRYDESRTVASAAINPNDASENADYLKRMVKLEPKGNPAPAFAVAKSGSPGITPVASAGNTKPAATYSKIVDPQPAKLAAKDDVAKAKKKGKATQSSDPWMTTVDTPVASAQPDFAATPSQPAAFRPASP